MTPYLSTIYTTHGPGPEAQGKQLTWTPVNVCATLPGYSHAVLHRNSSFFNPLRTFSSTLSELFLRSSPNFFFAPLRAFLKLAWGHRTSGALGAHDKGEQQAKSR